MSFGSAIGAIVSLKNNKRITKRKTGSFPGKSLFRDGVKSHRNPSKKELKELKEKMQREQKQRQAKIIFLSALLLIIICAGLYAMLS